MYVQNRVLFKSSKICIFKESACEFSFCGFSHFIFNTFHFGLTAILPSEWVPAMGMVAAAAAVLIKCVYVFNFEYAYKIAIER